jgi:arginyl-tRNA synthetase
MSEVKKGWLGESFYRVKEVTPWLKFNEFTEEADAAVTEACKSLGYESDGAGVSLPPGEEYGDLATSAPIRIAKSTSQKPAEVAVDLAAKMMEQKGSKYIGGVSPHRSGYVNISINYPRFLVDSISAVLDGDLGAHAAGEKTYVVEHTNVNPNKALHIGHARNLVLGDSLVRVLRYLGNRVRALNYVDDSGAQVADVIVGFRFLHLSDEPPVETKFDVYSGDSVYTTVTAEYARDPKLKEKQSLVLQEIEKGTGELAEYTRSIVRRILSAQLVTCWRLGASYDLLNWESQLVHSGMWDGIFMRLKREGYVKFETEGVNKGCWVIPDPITGEQKVVVRSDGTAVYVAKDIPYAAWKIGLIGDPFGYEVFSERQPTGGTLYSTTLGARKTEMSFGGADVAVSVIDARQSYLQAIVAKVLERLQDGASARYLHRAYEVVALSKRTAAQLGFDIGGDFAHMSGRKGLYVNVDKMLEVLKEKARTETRRHNLSEADGWVEDVAEAIAVSALRYELLKQDPDKMIVFDIEEALRFEGDTGPYLLYTYARARRILDKTVGKPHIDLSSASKLTKPQELRLVKRLSMLDLAAAKAGEYHSPKEVARYAHELAVAMNDFYERVQVNKEEDHDIRDARLALVEAASLVLAEAMNLMGIPYRAKI